MQKKRSKYKPLIQLAFETGLRFEDILRLKNKNVRKYDDDHFKVTFKRSKKFNSSDDSIYIRRDLLENIRIFYSRNSYFMFDSLSKEKRYTAYGKLRYWIRQSVGAVRNLDDEDMQGVGFHITRRTFMNIGVNTGSFTFEQGSRNLGHTSIRVTEKHYFHLRKNPQNSIVNYFKLKELNNENTLCRQNNKLR